MVELQTTWSWLPAIYLFLGGLGAGAFLTASVLRLAKPGRFKKTVTGGVWTAVAALAIGLLALVSEVEKPFQAMILFKSFVNGSSWMTVGAWLLLVTFVVFVLSALFTTDKLADWLVSACKPLGRARAGINKALAVVGIPLALAVAVYTGVLLSAAPAIPLWGTWLLPALFTVSALDTGVAAVSVFAAVLEKDDEAHGACVRRSKGRCGLVVSRLRCSPRFLTTMQGAGADEARASGCSRGPVERAVLGARGGRGVGRPALWRPCPGGDVEAKDKMALGPPCRWAARACALVGGFTLRFRGAGGRLACRARQSGGAAGGSGRAAVGFVTIEMRRACAFVAHARPEGRQIWRQARLSRTRGEGGHVLVSVGHVFAGGFAGFFGASGCGSRPILAGSWEGFAVGLATADLSTVREGRSCWNSRRCYWACPLILSILTSRCTQAPERLIMQRLARRGAGGVSVAGVGRVGRFELPGGPRGHRAGVHGASLPQGARCDDWRR